ncbi:AraC family transcriptional regulator [Microvirga sp. VF16]|uniref:helix-turn-helix domain-containing protein n=1 Tax=Microvirga sp. VF16 TaxID=2807101 RepID=UPI00193D7773|nr:helix-turn-helix transcriptional regulator [Microvirga sp. VF16]QRM34680.1 helix-turn-helix transcriptional regulator [Microvirga sp. VF16]
MTTHSLLSTPTPTADPEPEAHPLLLAILEERVKQTKDGPGYEWAADIRRLLSPWLTSHRRSVDDMADLLAMSRRTLDRRLRSRGIKYKALASEIRFEVACRLLKDTELSLSQVAAALGYSEASAFTRAFRGWCGQAPSMWRAAHAADVLTTL